MLDVPLNRLIDAPLLGVCALLCLASPALAQSTSDDEDVFGEIPIAPEQSSAQERQALETAQPEVKLPDQRRNTPPIRTLQRKTFMKIGRYEASPHIGFVTNDPFVNRYLVGAGFAYHVTEVFAVELSGTFSPDLGDLDYKVITKQIISQNAVTPDISKIQFYASGNVHFSPIYGKVAVGAGRIINFDIFGLFGAGVVNTRDDLEALQVDTDPAALATQNQFHPTLNFGGGARIVFSEGFAIRIEGRGLSYIEVLESTTLEMKNNFTLIAAASLFFPGME